MKSRDELVFTIVNDTHHLIPYDRALLFQWEEDSKPRIIGISGESSVNHSSQLIKDWTALVTELENPNESGELSAARFGEAGAPHWEKLQQEHPSAAYWLPIAYQKKRVLGIYFEQHKKDKWQLPIADMEVLLQQFLAPAYGIAWGRFQKAPWLQKLGLHKRKVLTAGLAALALLSFIPVPLRIVAPCEVVAKDPYVVRTELKGVIRELEVQPGELVSPGQTLFQYDPESLEKLLEIAQRDYQIKQRELEHAAIASVGDQGAQNELVIRELHSRKALAELKLAQHEVTLLDAKAPVSGIVQLDKPEAWTGRAVELGEKVMVINDPDRTALKIFLPESDNVVFNRDKGVKVFLKGSPAKSYHAQIRYVANELSMSRSGVPSYLAEADWLGSQGEHVKLGQQGSAVLYGDKVPLIYCASPTLQRGASSAINSPPGLSLC